jgi:hypothetical protein
MLLPRVMKERGSQGHNVSAGAESTENLLMSAEVWAGQHFIALRAPLVRHNPSPNACLQTWCHPHPAEDRLPFITALIKSVLL